MCEKIVRYHIRDVLALLPAGSELRKYGGRVVRKVRTRSLYGGRRYGRCSLDEAGNISLRGQTECLRASSNNPSLIALSAPPIGEQVDSLVRGKP